MMNKNHSDYSSFPKALLSLDACFNNYIAALIDYFSAYSQNEGESIVSSLR